MRTIGRTAVWQCNIIMAVQWLKAKHAKAKPRGGYTSKHNDSTKRRAIPKRKANDKERAAIKATQPEVVLVLAANGKKTFVRVYPTEE